MRKVSLNEIYKIFCMARYTDEWIYIDNWYEEEINIDEIYCLHSDFRGFPLIKDKKYIELYEKLKPIIDNGYFPFSHRLKDPAKFELPILILDREKKYLLDGQLRIFNYIRNGNKKIKAYVYKQIV